MSNRWTEEEDEALVNLREEGYTAREIAVRLRRSPGAVKVRLAEKAKKRRLWTKEEDARLKELKLEGKPTKYIAKVLDRSVRAIQARINLIDWS